MNHYFPVEIGSKGFYNTSLPKCLSALDIPKGKKKKIMDRAAKIALRGSYAIWLSRNSKAFQQMTLIPMPNINPEGSEMVVTTQNKFNLPRYVNTCHIGYFAPKD